MSSAIGHQILTDSGSRQGGPRVRDSPGEGHGATAHSTPAGRRQAPPSPAPLAPQEESCQQMEAASLLWPLTPDPSTCAQPRRAARSRQGSCLGVAASPAFLRESAAAS